MTVSRARQHIPKVDTGDDYDFMCGTTAFGAMVDARCLCQSCLKKTLDIVDLLSQAYDELNAGFNPTADRKRRQRLLKKIDKALGKRPTVDYSMPPEGT